MTTETKLATTVGILVAAPLMIFVATYVAQEDPVYLWDWGGYFRLYQHFGSMLLDDPIRWLKDLLRGIRRDDYNASSVALLSGPYMIYGGSRVAFISSLALFFIIPAATVAAVTSLRYSTDRCGRTNVYLIITATITAIVFPPFWQSAIRGLPDIVGLIPLTISTYLLLKYDFLTKATVKQALVIGLLIWCTFLFRRWYAYACFSLVFVSLCFATLHLARDSSNRLVSLRIIITRFAATGLAIVIPLIVLQKTLTVRILTTNYAEIYSGYTQPLTQQLVETLSHIGPFYLVTIVFGFGLALWNRNVPVVFTTITALLTYALFSLTQSPGVQHILPVSLWLFPNIVYLLSRIFSIDAAKSTQRLKAIACCGLSILLFSVSFMPRAQSLPSAISWLGPHRQYLPLQQENFPEYLRLIETIKSFTNQGDQMSVFASSGVLSDSLLEAIDNSLGDRMQWASQVDARDGFRLGSLRSRYTLVTDPITLHLNPDSQRVISIPAEQILSGTGIGRSYKRIDGPYQLAGGHKAYIYERTGELTRGEIEEATKTFQTAYPNWSLLNDELIYVAH